MRFTRSQTRRLAGQQKRELAADPIEIDVEDRNNVGESALMRSCMKSNNLEEFNELIRKGADPNSSDLTRNTILSVAVLNRQYEKLEVLLEKGANPELESGREKNRTIHDILHMAFENPRLDSVVHLRFREGTLAMFKMALDFGVDMKARNKKGETGISLLNKLDKLKDGDRGMVDDMKKYYEEKKREADKRRREELDDDKDAGPSPKVPKQNEVEVEEDGIDVRGGVMEKLYVSYEVEVEKNGGEEEEGEEEITEGEKKRLEDKMMEEALAKMKEGEQKIEEHEVEDYEKEEDFGDKSEEKQEEENMLGQGIEEVEEENEEIDEEEKEEEEQDNEKEEEHVFEENKEDHSEEGPIEMEQRGEEFEQEQGDGLEDGVVQVDQMDYLNFPIATPVEVAQPTPHIDYFGGVQHLLPHPNFPIGAAGVEQNVPVLNLDGLDISALLLLSNYYNQLPLQPIAPPPVTVAPPSAQYIFPPMSMNIFNPPVALLNAPTWPPINHQDYFPQPTPILNNEPVINFQREPIVEVPPEFDMSEFNRIYFNNRN